MRHGFRSARQRAWYDGLERRLVLCGRLAVIVGMAAFGFTYIALLVHIGVLAGVAAGWLVAGTVGWLTTWTVYRTGCSYLRIPAHIIR
ncbi:hypothetical protein E4K72_18210 [Oxalobacteraceae bacterium OM1]|nr:hypothetical protein E4K72_18210 [Oxalobacteraceae bacterium OM1]